MNQTNPPKFKSRPLRRHPNRTALVFSPLAWLKLMFFLHAGETEVGGFGVSSESDLLYVQDFVAIKQWASGMSVEFADDAVADHFDAMVDAGLQPARFARIWCHTHPGNSPEPSAVDERTFSRVFGACDWSVMFIISNAGRTYARLRFGAGPGGSMLIPVEVDWAAWPRLSPEEAARLPQCMLEWAREHDRNISVIERGLISIRGWDDAADRDESYDLEPLVPGDPTIDQQAVYEFEQEGVRP